MGVDLGDFYPAAATASQSRNAAGGQANPGAPSGMKGLSLSASGSANIGGSPALAMIGIVAAALFLLHLE